MPGMLMQAPAAAPNAANAAGEFKPKGFKRGSRGSRGSLRRMESQAVAEKAKEVKDKAEAEAAFLDFQDDEAEAPAAAVAPTAGTDDIDEFGDEEGDDLGASTSSFERPLADLGAVDLGADDLGADDFGDDVDDGEFADDAPAVPDAEFDDGDELDGEGGELDDADGGDHEMDEDFDDNGDDLGASTSSFERPPADMANEAEAGATMATEDDGAPLTDEEDELTEAAAVPEATADYDAENLDDDDDDELDDVEASYDDVTPVVAAPKVNPNGIMIERLDT